jgi:hypothetical protein
VTVTVPDAVLPWEFCTVYGKFNDVPDVMEAVNPPLASITTPVGSVVGTTTVKGKPLGSEFPSKRPGDGTFIYVEVRAL